MTSPGIFIGYATADRAIAQEIAELLERRGYLVLWHTGFFAGAEDPEARKYMAKADTVIVIWTENAHHSAWVQAAANHALREGKPLIQIKAPNIDINSIPLPFRDLPIFDIEDRYSILRTLPDIFARRAAEPPTAAMPPEKPGFPPMAGAPPPAAARPEPQSQYWDIKAMLPEPELKHEEKPVRADATAFCPGKFRAGESELVQIIIHLKGRRAKALQLAREADTRTYFAAPSRGVGELETGDEISVQLDVRGAKVDDPPQKQVWQGEALTFGFGVTSNGQTRSVTVSAVVSINGIAIGRISFSRPVAHSFKLTDIFALLFQPRLSRFKHAFFSYARPDRQIVKKVAAQYEKYGISFFQDVLHLDPGERWEKRLYKEIDRCDIFVLFWSSSASKSEWVVKEAERAWRRNARTGGSRPTLTPEILEHPSPKPQQEWLREFHLDDPKFYRD